MIDNTTDRLKDLCAQREACMLQLRDLDIAIDDEECEILQDKFKFKIGSEVSSKGLIYKIVSIDTLCRNVNQKPWLKGVVKTKAGGYGTKVIRLYDDWTVLSTGS